jgi:transcriptional regulator with XRE-family HTH domain
MFEKEVNAIIGRNIRIRRTYQGYSQSALATRLGVTFQQVQKYEKGHSPVSPARLLQLSQLFGCGVDALFGDLLQAPGRYTLTNVPGRRLLHLVQHFERLPSPLLQKRIVDLVSALAAPPDPGQASS